MIVVRIRNKGDKAVLAAWFGEQKETACNGLAGFLTGSTMISGARVAVLRLPRRHENGDAADCSSTPHH